MDKEVWNEVHYILGTVGPALISLASVWLGWRLSSQSQRLQRSLDVLKGRFVALREIMSVAENVPPNLRSPELQTKLEADPDFCRNLTGRLIRLFGLRWELIPDLDHDIAEFIDRRFKPLFITETGSYDLPSHNLAAFAAAAVELRHLAGRTEARLVKDYEKLRK